MDKQLGRLIRARAGRGNGLKANTPGRMGSANFLNKPEECKHGKMIFHCAPCFKNAKK